MAYQKMKDYDEEITQKLIKNYRENIALLGKILNREGLIKTPERIAKAMQFVTQGYQPGCTCNFKFCKVS